MATKNSPDGHADEPKSSTPRQDPWNAFGYLVAGVGFYGFVGWALDQWWGTNFMVAIGVVAGAGLGIYMTVKAFQPPTAPDENKN